MKKHVFLFFALLALASQVASAQTIRRVNNTGITGTNIYTTLQAAHNAAATGDIIHLEPSTVSYGDLTCTKNLRIVGPGYFLGANQPPPLQANTQTASVGSIEFNGPSNGTPGSSGSSLAGVTASFLYVNTSGITVQRNSIINTVSVGSYNTVTNIIIRQNYASAISMGYYAGTGMVVANNIITYSASLTYGNGEFTNNVVTNSGSFNNYLVRNNYFGDTNGGIETTIITNYSYNLFAFPTLPVLGSRGSGNVANVALSDVFVLGPGGSSAEYDGWYKLKTGTNPARNAAQGGLTDIGAFSAFGGAANTYRLSGIPPIPTIYQIDQQTVGNSLNLTIGTRSNN